MTALAEAYYRRLYAFHDDSPVIPLEEFYNSNHDPKDGKFTTGPRGKIGTGGKGGKVWTGVSADPDNRVKPKSKVHFPIEPDDFETPGEARARFGSSIYDADLGDGYQARVTGVRVIPNGISVVIKIRKGHEEVGEASRELTTAEDGRLIAHHETLYIAGKHQGLGIADRFNAHAVAEYQRLGVDHIDLHAGASVGGYAWARQGYRIFEGDRKKFLNTQLDRLETQLKIPVLRPHAKRLREDAAVLRKAIEAGEDVQPIHLASLGEKYARHTARDDHRREYPTWPGKSLLIGTTWLGQYYFDANRAVTAAATDLEHAALRPAFRTEGIEEFFNKNHSPQDGKFTSGPGGSSPSGHGRVMKEIGEIDIHGRGAFITLVQDAGLVKHLGSLAVVKEMTDRERAGLENDLDYEVKDFSSMSTEPFALVVAIANANVATVPRTTVGVSAQLGAIHDRYEDDFKVMDKVTEALTRYEGEYQTDLRGARAKLSRELERISGVSVASGFVSYVHQQWANSAHSHESVAMQLIAARDRKLTAAGTSLKNHVRPADLAVAKHLVKTAPDALGAVFSATYRLTQRELAKHGITEIELYRGVNISGMRTTSAVNSLAKIIAQPSPLSSWSTSQTEAFNFSLHGKMYKARVPVSQVYSLANLTGTGSLSEREVLVLGNRITATEHELQISNADAQNFNDFAEEEIPVVEIDAEDFDWIKKRPVTASASTGTLAAVIQEFFNKNHDKAGRFATSAGHKVITAAQARGDSRPVSHDEFQRLATIGQAQLDRFAERSSPITRLDRNWDQIKRDAYEEVKKSWGGATIDSHTGVALPQGANAFAITVKGKNGKTVSVHENATEAEFNAAMDTARARFGTILARQSHYIGVFHDDSLGRIDIDPVIVLHSREDVDTVGAASFSIGGAYHFATGDGAWPPHVVSG